ncbi:MAG: 16S rRNA (guanine(527)-N(7))-methyltransferase RsmG [Pseudomonadota bacterium]
MSEDAAKAAVAAAVSTEVFKTLETFERALRTWNAVSNLVSAADGARLWSRHIADSLQLVALAPDGPLRWIDLGAGAGFPGMVVALARPQTEVTLVESNRKKAAFLLKAIAETGAPATVRPVRAEALPAKPYDVVSARALAPLGPLLTLAAPFFGPHTIGLFPKGREVDDEIAAAGAGFQVARVPSATADDAVILKITDVKG